MSIERQTGVKPAQLAEERPLPPACANAWRAFLEMHACRSVIPGGLGPSRPARISFVEIDAYQRVTGARLQPWELEAVRAADSAYIASVPSK